MKNFSRFQKFGILFFIISYIFLILWAFNGTRTYLKFKTLQIAGFAMGKPSYFPEDIFLSMFHPEPERVPVSEHILTQPAMPVIEFHGHIFGTYDQNEFHLNLEKNHTKYYINLALRTVTPADFKKLKEKIGEDKRIYHFPGLNWSRLENDDFQGMADDLEEIVKLGDIRGIKIWKDFGLKFRTSDGLLLKLDDPRMDPVWDVCKKYNLIIAMHTADPPAFFKKIDGSNERFPELGRHPDWSFTGGDLPLFDELIQQRDRLFKRRSQNRFVAQHFGELAHDLNRAAEMLDSNPNVQLDIAQRIDELGRQPEASRSFFLKYQDRILYGTDGMPDYEKVRIYWRFLETNDEYFNYHPPHKPEKGKWKIYGLGLPKSVLRKIYYENAFKMLEENR